MIDWSTLDEKERAAIEGRPAADAGGSPAETAAPGASAPETAAPEPTPPEPAPGKPAARLPKLLSARGPRPPEQKIAPRATAPAGPSAPPGAEAASAVPQPQPWHAPAPKRDRYGLALSGGGMRSATFNLGVLQELARRGLLSGFDYLSTVSGGGYVGGFWSAWQSREPKTRAGRFPSTPPGHPEPPEVRHLRTFSNFLQPRLSLVSVEAGRLVAALASGVLPSVGVALTTIVAALLLWLAGAWLLLAATPGRWTFGILPQGLVPGAVLALGTLAVHTGWEWGRWRHEEPAARSRAVHGLAVAVSVPVAATVWAVLWHFVPLPFAALVRPPAFEPPSVLHLAALLLPCAAWLLTAGLLVVARTLAGRFIDSHRRRARLAAADRVLAQVVFCAAVWGVVGTLWWIGLLLAAGGLTAVLSAAGVSTAGGGAFAWLRRLLDRRPPQPGRRLSLARPLMLKLLAYLTLAAAVAAAAGLLVVLGVVGEGRDWVVSVAVVLVILLLTLLLFDPHESGFHSFYRARLVRGFLGASNPDRDADCRPRWRSATSECERDDVPLGKLPVRPLHLVCCAANDLAGDPLATLHRGADSAVLSRVGLQVGSACHAWEEQAPRPTLGEAMTASGAAFNSHMGAVSMQLGQAATFLLAALGLRLGLWIQTPGSDRVPRIRPDLPGQLFFRELFSLSSSEGEWVHLSDGAHFENLALYELVRRHCRFILLSDCGSDPERSFGDFGNAVRRIREDFGVEVEIDLTPLRPGGDGFAPQAMVAGDLVYPGGDRGTLLYLKPTRTRNEPPDVGQYARANPKFPHQPTLDQYYDEAQWESYRRLGEWVVTQAFGDIAPATDAAVSARALGKSFLLARYRWPMPPETAPAVLVRLEERWTALEDRLRAPEHAALRAQVEPLAAAPAVAPAPAGEDAAGEEGWAGIELLQEALQLMEITYLQTGMSATYHAPSHPRFMGWLNRFGLWCGAPAFHRAWPLLAPRLAEPFARFLVDAFRLPKVEGWRGEVVKLDAEDSPGFALSRWLEVRPAEGLDASQPRERFALEVDLGGGRTLQAGVVEVVSGAGTAEMASRDGLIDEAPGDGVVSGVAGRGVARWNSRHFYVPPGLWAVGVGEVFLDRLVQKLFRLHFERLSVDVDAASSSTDTDSLYTGAGFQRTATGFERTPDGLERTHPHSSIP